LQSPAQPSKKKTGRRKKNKTAFAKKKTKKQKLFLRGLHETNGNAETNRATALASTSRAKAPVQGGNGEWACLSAETTAMAHQALVIF